MRLTALCFLLLMAAIRLCGAVSPAENGDSVAMRSLKALQERAQKGDNEARFRLARTLETGYGTLLKRDSIQARRLFEQAAEAGYAPAQNYLGFLLFSDGKPREAIDWMMCAAEKGDLTAYTNLGWMLLYGNGAVRDVEKALYWLRRGADLGSAPAEAMLGDVYREGIGVAADSAAALNHYDRALELYSQAGYRDARAVADISKGINALFPAPETLCTDSLMTLGRKYLKVAPAAGMRFIAVAAEKDLPIAQALVAKAYAFGHGIPYDHAKSLAWYLRAALGGNASAQFVLGELLQMLPDALDELPQELTTPLSTEQKTGVYWLEKAQEAGITDARQADDALGLPEFP